MKNKIRLADVDDSAGIAHVQITSYRTAYARFFPQAYLDHFTYEEQTQDWRDLMRDPEHDPLFVAADEERGIVGYALGTAETEGFEPKFGELVALHVLPEHQRHGIGRRLFARMAAELQERGKTALMLWTIKENPVRAFYERLGGALAGEKSYKVDNMTVTEVAYGWNDMDELLELLNAKQLECE